MLIVLLTSPFILRSLFLIKGANGDRPKLLHDKCAVLFETLREESKFDSSSPIQFYVYFIFRRLLFVTLAYFLSEYPFFQAQILYTISMLLITFLVRVRPFRSTLMNRMEIFNEVTVLICTYHVLLFTDFVEDSLL